MTRLPLIALCLLFSASALAQQHKISVQAFTASSATAFAFSDDFKPVSPEELALKDNNKQPGAHAMILEWTDDENDETQSAVHYFRIKIFTDEGKKYGDIEIPYFEGSSRIGEIKARTIHADGTVIPFTGTIHDKLVVKTKSLKYQAKTFTLPNVQSSSIIEYRYKSSWNGYSQTSWTLQSDLFIKRAQFTLKAANFRNFGMGYVAVGLASDDALQKKNGFYSLTITDVPAFVEEPFAPPDQELKPHISFFYMPLGINTKENFWKLVGQDRFKAIEDFVNHRSAVQAAVPSLVSASDPIEIKLRKLYDRTQQIKNLSFQRERTGQEAKREKIQEAKSADEVLNLGYGYHYAINRLFAAFVRAAGVEAEIVPTSRRDRFFFKPNMLSPGQLDRELVMVKVNGRERYFDPGTPLCPFGLLPWRVAGSEGYQVNKDGGDFIKTPQPQSKDAVTRRTAHLKLTAEGAANGTVEVQYEGQEALSWRLAAVTSDETQVRSQMEDQMKHLLPNGSVVKLTGLENLNDEYQSLVATFEVLISDFASKAGARSLIAPEIFRSGGANPFASKKRVHPVYFDFPYLEVDTINLELPESMHIEALPEGKTKQSDFGYYASHFAQHENVVTMTRRFAIQSVLIDSSYQDVRSLFEQARAGDQDTVVLQAVIH